MDDTDVLQAEKIYRTYFPDPTNTSKEVNFAAGTLEAMSAVTRAVTLLNLSVVNGITTGLTVNPYLFPFDTVIHRTKNGITEINWAFSRLRNSYSSLDNFVQSLNGKTVLTIGQSAASNSIARLPTLPFFNLPLLYSKIEVHCHQQMSNSATDQFQMMTSGLSPFLCATNSSCYTPGSSGSSQSNPSGGSPANSLALLYMSNILSTLASQSGDTVNISLLQLAWQDPPPSHPEPSYGRCKRLELRIRSSYDQLLQSNSESMAAAIQYL